VIANAGTLHPATLIGFCVIWVCVSSNAKWNSLRYWAKQINEAAVISAHSAFPGKLRAEHRFAAFVLQGFLQQYPAHACRHLLCWREALFLLVPVAQGALQIPRLRRGQPWTSPRCCACSSQSRRRGRRNKTICKLRGTGKTPPCIRRVALAWFVFSATTARARLPISPVQTVEQYKSQRCITKNTRDMHTLTI